MIFVGWLVNCLRNVPRDPRGDPTASGVGTSIVVISSMTSGQGRAVMNAVTSPVLGSRGVVGDRGGGGGTDALLLAG